MRSTIKGKLLIGFGLTLILLVGIAVFMINRLSQSNTILENLVEVSSQKINLSNEILVNVMDAARHEKNMILEPDPAKSGLFKDKLYLAADKVDKLIPELMELVDAGGKEILTEFKTTWDNYKIDMDEIIALALKNENDKAIVLSTQKGAKTRDKTLNLLTRLVEKNKAGMINDKIQNAETFRSSINIVIGLVIFCLLIAISIAYWIIKSIAGRIAFIAAQAGKIASREFSDEKMNDVTKDELKPIFDSLVNINESFNEITGQARSVASGNYEVVLEPRSEKDILGNALKKMTRVLKDTTAENEKHIWLTTGQNRLSEQLRGDQSIEELCNNTISFLCNYINAGIGSIYLRDLQKNELSLSGMYAFSSETKVKESFAINEGLIGQAAYEKKPIFLNEVNSEALRITSSVINVKPGYIMVYPFQFEGNVMGVIELARLNAFSDIEKQFIDSSLESIGISLNSAIARKKIQMLLEETQVQSEELQSQQEELKQLNEELEEQAQNLKQQQEELQMTNEELEEQTQALELKNKDIEAAKFDIERKTKQLEISGRYKSEFLANMSHELRTPLNSLLILSKDLAENRNKNLNDDQVESAEIINKSGHDLLNLINEVLDLSKIEAGKMNITIEKIAVKDLINNLKKTFRVQAEQKQLKLETEFIGPLHAYIDSDRQRLEQILKNILSNAIKFTHAGKVTISAENLSDNSIAIKVKDTGIGISEDKQMVVFEAFQQADGGTSRKYGGTGLGLSISRELIKLLGGEITLTSKLNEGSVFTIILPVQSAQPISRAVEDQVVPELKAKPPLQESFYNYPTIEDDRDKIKADDKTVLIIEDDLKFAAIMVKQAHEKGFKCLSAATGEDGLVLAERFKPNAIMLDIDLPGIDGHKVLAELKGNSVLRHIPVHILSVNERSVEPIKSGAVEYFTKPIDKKQLDEAFSRIENFISRKMKNLLIIEDDENSRKAIRKLIGNGDVRCFEAGTGKDAISIVKENQIDCVVLDLGLPDISGFKLIYEFEKLKESRMPPIIVYTGRELSKEENDELQKYAETIIIKGVKSEERLLDETALFLHRTISNLPESKQKIISNLYDKEALLRGKKVLLVDDDMRNVFALSKILKEKGMEIIKADNGKVALDELKKNQGIDLVLMDIMMPEMDGYEAMRQLRLMEKFKTLPVIALTAKAMKEDRQKCIDAGANDYITKPVDVERLFTLIRVWLSK